jgi:hypothetical protein
MPIDPFLLDFFELKFAVKQDNSIPISTTLTSTILTKACVNVAYLNNIDDPATFYCY